MLERDNPEPSEPLRPPLDLVPPRDNQQPLDFYGRVLRNKLVELSPHRGELDRQIALLRQAPPGPDKIEAIEYVKQNLELELRGWQKEINRRRLALQCNEIAVKVQSCCCCSRARAVQLDQAREQLQRQQDQLTTDQSNVSAAWGAVARLQTVIREEKILAGL